MVRRLAIAAIAAIAAGLLGSCSSAPPPQPRQPGTLVVGTAEMTVNGEDAGTTGAVQCTPLGWLTTVVTGDGGDGGDGVDTSGITAMISNKEGLVAQFVRIHNVGGFTGSYNAGLGGEADVTMTGRTYNITGIAQGFNAADPIYRTTDNTFVIKVAC